MSRKLQNHISIFILPFFVWICLYPNWAIALTAFEAGQSLGAESLASQVFSDFDEDTGTIKVYPGGDLPIEINMHDVYPDLDENSDTSVFDNYYEDDDAIEEGADTTVADLNEADTMTGEAFRTIYGGMQNNSHPDIRNDPMWTQTDTVLDQVFNGDFSDCVMTTKATVSESDVRVPEYHRCERVVKDQECMAERVVTQLDYNVGAKCEPGKEVFGFAGYKSYHSYVCNEDGKTMTVNSHGLELPYGEEYFYISNPDYSTQPIVYIATCEGEGPGKVCTYSGGTWRRHHPNLGKIGNNEEAMWDAHDQSSDTFVYMNSRLEGVDLEDTNQDLRQELYQLFPDLSR